MSRSYHVPSSDDFLDLDSFANRIAQEHRSAPGATTTTQSNTGEPRITVTSYTMSDVLQGTLNHRDPRETSLLINKVLTEHMDFLDSQGYAGLVATSGQTPAMINQNGDIDTQGNGGGAYAPSDAIDPSTGNLSQQWVEKLPTTHANGAIIWHSRGKGSREMHLPTHEDLETDISQHKQHNFAKEEWKHPWNMDRRGGGIGGETGYWTSVDGSHGTIMKEDNPNEGGQPGAFGYLDPTLEQYYISAAWPYSGDPVDGFKKIGRDDIAEKAASLKKNLYAGKKILVYSIKTQKGCVTSPGDWGPHPYHSVGQGYDSINGFYFGLSPDVHHVLGTDHGDEFIIGWLPDSTPVGPYTAAPAGFSGGPSQTVGASGNILRNTDEEMAYAGQMIVNHPNFRMDGSDHGADVRSTFLNGYTIDTRAKNMTPAKKHSNPAQGWIMPSLLNWLWYILEGGFLLGGCGGIYGYKPKGGKPGNPPSNHGKGGAIDISNIGLATEGRMFSTWNLASSRHMCEILIDFMASLPNNCRPEEIGGPYSTEHPIRVYYDKGHFHFGFNENQCGELIPALKPKQNGGNGFLRSQ